MVIYFHTSVLNLEKKKQKNVMARLCRVAELQQSSNSVEWDEMMIFYCRKKAIEYFKLSREINGVCMKLNGACIERGFFIQELETVAGKVVPQKTALFLRELQAKDDIKVAELQILGREMELRGREIDLLVEKLKGLVPF